MTTLASEQPHQCKTMVMNYPIVTVCDQQCEYCKEYYKSED